MHTEMWEHAAVKDNMATLRRRGVHVVEPEAGRLAGGDMGAGRLAETGVIVAEAARILSATRNRPRGDKALRAGACCHSGGTREPIDPVRFLSNRSSEDKVMPLPRLRSSLARRSLS